jgi:hypothetical protein
LGPESDFGSDDVSDTAQWRISMDLLSSMGVKMLCVLPAGKALG